VDLDRRTLLAIGVAATAPPYRSPAELPRPGGQAGLLARFSGSHGDSPRIEYATPTTHSRSGREAWLVGGGEDAQVVYSHPR
jgi:hypothetical protein